MKNLTWVLILVVGCGSKNSDSSTKSQIKDGSYKLTTKEFIIQTPAAHINCTITGDMQYKIEWKDDKALATLSGSSKYTCDNGMTNSVGCKTGQTVGLVTLDADGTQTSNLVQTDTCVNAYVTTGTTTSAAAAPVLSRKWSQTSDGFTVEMTIQNSGITGVIKDTFTAL